MLEIAAAVELASLEEARALERVMQICTTPWQVEVAKQKVAEISTIPDIGSFGIGICIRTQLAGRSSP